MRWVRILAIIFVVLLLAAFVLLYLPMRVTHPVAIPPKGSLAIIAGRVYTTPDAPPIEHGTVLVRDGMITAVGQDLAIPPGATVIACENCSLLAGFWNTHVHFTEPKWNWSDWKPADTLNAQLADMLTSRGFTSVVDLGSNPLVTLPLRRRIESGNLLGPSIYTAGAALYPPKGIPYYLHSLPWFLRWSMPQPRDAAEAAAAVSRNNLRGSDVLKLFTGSYVARGVVKPMPLPVAQSAVDTAHLYGQVVFAHPSNLEGARIAIASGVDVLAHAPDTTEGVDEGVIREMVKRKMAMIPTLKMFATTVTTNPAYLQPIYDIVRRFRDAGGQLLFGTDVGYMTDYDTSDEIRALQKCGLSAREILQMLTTAPAQRMGAADSRGTIAPGKWADLVVVDGDPMQDAVNFSRVRATVRLGRVVYERPAP